MCNKNENTIQKEYVNDMLRYAKQIEKYNKLFKGN